MASKEELMHEIRAILKFMDAAGLLGIVSIDRLISFVTWQKERRVFDPELIAYMALEHLLMYDTEASTTSKELADVLRASPPADDEEKEKS